MEGIGAMSPFHIAEDHKPCPKVISHVRCTFVSRLMSPHMRGTAHYIAELGNGAGEGLYLFSGKEMKTKK